MRVDLMPTLLDSALKGSVILILAALAALWLRRGSAASRHLVWQLGLFGMLVLPLASALRPDSMKWEVLPSSGNVRSLLVAPTPATLQDDRSTPTPLTNLEREATAQDATSTPSSSSRASSGNPTTPAASTTDTRTLPQRALPWLMLVWALGAGAVLARFAIGM